MMSKNKKINKENRGLNDAASSHTLSADAHITKSQVIAKPQNAATNKLGALSWRIEQLEGHYSHHRLQDRLQGKTPHSHTEPHKPIKPKTHLSQHTGYASGLQRLKKLSETYTAKLKNNSQTKQETQPDIQVEQGIQALTFVPPSPLFSLVLRYPMLASYSNQLLYWDTHLCIRINRYSSHQWIAQSFKIISRLGDGWFWYAMLMLAAVLGGFAVVPAVLATIGTSLLGVVIYKLLKVKTVRPRPYQVHQVIVLGERPLDVFSFPSGHTLQAVLFTSALGVIVPAMLWVMLPFAVLVAISRMVLGLHYPTDVLIGAGLGYALFLLTPVITLWLMSVTAFL